MNSDKAFLILNSVLILCVLVFFLLISGNSFFWYDDFNNIQSIQNKGIIKDAIDIYMGWDGRGLSPLAMFRGLILINFSPEVIAVLSIFTLLVCGWFCVLIISDKTNRASFETLFYALIFSIFLWMTFRPHLSRSIFWATGSYYIYSNLILLMGVYFFKKTNTKIWILICLSLIIGLSGINSAIAFLVFCCLWWVTNMKSYVNGKIAIVGVVIITGMVISVLAPGNFNRIGTGDNQLAFEITLFPINYITIFKEYLLMSKWLFIGAFLFGIAYVKTDVTTSGKSLTSALIYLVSALSTIIPFLPLPEAASKHTAIFFQSFLFIAVVHFIFYLRSFFQIKYWYWLKWAIPAMLLYIVFNVYEQYQIGRQIKPLILKRHEFLHSMKNQPDTIYLDRIDQPAHYYTNRFFEISEDPTQPNNKGLQGIFKTGPIVLKAK